MKTGTAALQRMLFCVKAAGGGGTGGGVGPEGFEQNCCQPAQQCREGASVGSAWGPHGRALAGMQADPQISTLASSRAELKITRGISPLDALLGVGERLSYRLRG